MFKLRNWNKSVLVLLLTVLLYKANGQCTIPGLSIIATDDTICPGTQVALFPDGATSYTLNPGNIVSNFFPVTPTLTTTYSITATSGTCIATKTISIFVLPLPSQPVSITGYTLVTVGNIVNYSITPVPDAISYSWTLPNGWSGSSTTNSINIAIGTAYTNTLIGVSATNSCGIGPTRTLAVTSYTCNAPNQPSAVIGNTVALAGTIQTYSTPVVPGATAYNWVFPADWTGSSTTNSINVTVGNTSGLIGVSAYNNCSPSSYTNLSVSITSTCTVPNQPTAIVGNTLVPANSTQTYSVAPVPNATSYSWYLLTAGIMPSSSNNTVSINVGNLTDTLLVIAINNCGASITNSLIITVSSSTASSVSMLPVLVKDIATSFTYTDSDPEQFTSFAGKTYFVAKSGATDVPYYTDGTTAGTSALAPNLVLDFCYFLGEFKNRLYFSSSNSSTGMELWSTDGTATGTVLLKDINPSGSSNPTMFTVVGNSLFFAANDGVHGTELWVTDGTEIGTHMTYDMEPSSVPSDGAFTGSGIALGNSIVFSRLTEPTDRNDLWIMDEFGSVATNLTQQFTGLYSVYANATKRILYNNKIYFNFNEGNEGDELFVTDGTVSGTQVFKMIPGNSALSPNDFFLFNNNLCFTGFATGIGCCPDLFISDGTQPGTISLNAFAVAPSYAINNNTLYFYGGDNTNGYELWKSDGTPSGTNMVKDIRVGGGSSGVNNLSWCAGKLYFTANDGVNQSQPWVSDGTTGGTMMLKNIYNGTNGSYSNNFIEYNSSVFFTARLAFNNFHLFQTNGTTVGTNTIQPIDATNSSNPLGENGSVLTIPTAIKVNNGMVFMKANFHNVGRELYAIGSSQVSVIDLDKLDETHLIYPNPSNGYFKLKSSEHLKNSIIKIYNTHGQIVFETTLLIEEIDLSNQPKGIYFLQIKSQNKTVNQKIILQ